MKTLLKFISVLIIQIASIRSDICSEKDNLNVIEAFRVRDSAVVLTAQKNFYRAKNLVFNENEKKFNFSYVSKLDHWSTKLSTVRVFFTMKYPNISTDEIKLFGIAWEERHQIPQLVGYRIEVDYKFDITVHEFNVNIYRYKPGEDPLNLQVLFRKYPEADIQDLMQAIMSFPLNGNPGMRVRLFAYYNEMPIKGKKYNTSTTVNPNASKFKRHLMYGQEEQYGSLTELDWKHELINGQKCWKQNNVDAAFALTDDYNKANNAFEFNLIEFSNTEYIVKKVKVNDTYVSEDPSEVTKGSTADVFACNSGEPRPPKTPDEPPPTNEPHGGPPDDKPADKKSVGESDWGWGWTVLVLLLICAAIALIAGILYFFLSKSGNAPPQANAVAPAPAPAPAPAATYTERTQTVTQTTGPASAETTDTPPTAVPVLGTTEPPAEPPKTLRTNSLGVESVRSPLAPSEANPSANSK